MARNMHGVDEDNATVKAIAHDALVHAGFVAAMIEYYSDVDGWRMDVTGTDLEQAIIHNAMVGAMAYDEQDDDADIEQTRKMRLWIVRKARMAVHAFGMA